jgi:hypothetical protein
MPQQSVANESLGDEISGIMLERSPLWQLDIVEVTGHHLEARGTGRGESVTGEGWRLLHIYTLRYQEDGVWRERPMAFLGAA